MHTQNTPGQLYLIPTVLDESALHTIPSYITETIKKCNVFMVENARTARRVATARLAGPNRKTAMPRTVPAPTGRVGAAPRPLLPISRRQHPRADQRVFGTLSSHRSYAFQPVWDFLYYRDFNTKDATTRSNDKSKAKLFEKLALNDQFISSGGRCIPE
jgi:hypothetical protein